MYEGGLEINLDKTKYLKTNNNFMQNLQIDDVIEIKPAEKFMCLEFTVIRKGGIEEEIKSKHNHK